MSSVLALAANGKKSDKRLLIFWVELGYLVGLLATAGLYFIRPGVKAALPAFFGPVPLGVPWFGALGAVATGLGAVLAHTTDWEDRHNCWHIARPFVGATLGIMASLIFLSLVAAGTPGTPAADFNGAIYYVIAFAVGYRERLFRELIKRITSMFFTLGRTDRADVPPPGGQSGVSPAAARS